MFRKPIFSDGTSTNGDFIENEIFTIPPQTQLEFRNKFIKKKFHKLKSNKKFGKSGFANKLYYIKPNNEKKS